MQRLLSVLFVVCVAPAAASAGVVQLERNDDGVRIQIDGKEFTTYRIGKGQQKPYFFPVLAADGANIARQLEKPEDHPHHKGIWCSIDEVNDIAFWAEKGKIENASIDIVKGEGDPATFRVVNHWLGTDGQPLLRETVTVNVHANRLLEYALEFAALDKSVRFGDTKEGMFGMRVANSLRGQAGGKISNAEGLKEEANCWGKESKWVDYVGTVNGKTYGVALFDDHRNFRKSRFHVRNYGLFTLSPFGQKAYTNGALPEDPLTLEPGKSVHLHYGLYVHDGDAGTAHVAEVYDSFLRQK
jgi:hypothetical protein